MQVITANNFRQVEEERERKSVNKNQEKVGVSQLGR